VNPETVRAITIIILFVLAAISILGIFGSAGFLGELFNKVVKSIFGWGSFLAPLILIFIAYVLIRGFEKTKLSLLNFLGIAVFILVLLGVFHLKFVPDEALYAVGEGEGGGFIGYMVSWASVNLMGVVASWIVFIALMVVSFLMIFNISFGAFLEKIKSLKNRIAQLFLKVKPQPKVKVKTIENGEFKTRNLNIEDGEVEGFARKELDDGEKIISDVDEDPKTQDVKPRTFQEDADWKFPSLSLLNDAFSKPTSGDIKAKANIIQKTLANFGIEVEMSDVSIGPTLTQYTLKPLEGVKLSRITALQNDLALALAAHPIRIEAPIPGKSLVGLEVPNEGIALVRIRELLESSEYRNDKSKLAIPLGRDVAGNPIVVDIADMPHMLIAGATGSGKSVCINSILVSLLYKNSPVDLRLILIDPKRVEMSHYNNIPHLLTPVLTEVNKTVNALKWTVSEMDRRYRLLQEVGKVNIDSYNASARSAKLPYIILAVDELADLMSVAAADVEGAIVRLAQMARAVGIHLLLSTQRPSVNVITGLIKANITSRVAFNVASQIDSRTIIDVQGAEKLLGNGDLLYVTAEQGKPKRIQGALIEEVEIKRVTEFLKKEATPEYNEDVTEKTKAGISRILGIGSDEDAEIDDELFHEAKEEIIRMGKGSASLLQRRLRIGYARAARLLDMLEEQGVVGPPDGSKPREVLIEKDEEKKTEEKN